MTLAASWTERFWRELPDARREWRESELPVTHGGDSIVGQIVADLGGTRSMLGITTPDEWQAVGEFLQALLEQEPLKQGSRYSGQRIILGTLANELLAYAHQAELCHAE